MKIFSTLLAFSFVGSLLVVTSAPSAAAGPAGRIIAKCVPGWTADPSWYTAAQLGSGIGVKYQCSRQLPPYPPNVFHPGFPYTCSDGFSALRENSGADAPKVENSGFVRYFCISSGPH